MLSFMSPEIGTTAFGIRENVFFSLSTFTVRLKIPFSEITFIITILNWYFAVYQVSQRSLMRRILIIISPASQQQATKPPGEARKPALLNHRRPTGSVIKKLCEHS